MTVLAWTLRIAVIALAFAAGAIWYRARPRPGCDRIHYVLLPPLPNENQPRDERGRFAKRPTGYLEMPPT